MIKDITYETYTANFIKEIKDGLKLENVFVSLLFPSYITVNATMYGSIHYYCKEGDLSIYSLCLGGSKSVSMVVIPYEEMHFNIKMKVNDKYDIELKDLKGSVTEDDLKRIIKEKVKEEKDGDYLIIEKHVFGEGMRLADIAFSLNTDDMLKNEDMYNHSLFWNVNVIKYKYVNTPIRVRTTDGIERIINVNLESTIGQLYVECMKLCNADDNLILSYAGKSLGPYLSSISSFGITKDIILYCSYFVPGGGFGFIDVRDTHALVSRPFSSDVPVWRYCTNGANLEGICVNKTCIAYDKSVIVKLGYGIFDLFHYKKYRCPCCDCYVELFKPSFTNCHWRIKYRIGQRTGETLDWETIGNKYQTYDEFKADFAEFSSVIIQAKPLSPEFKEKDEEVELCCICHKPFLSSKEEEEHEEMKKEVLFCDHKVHTKCVKDWCNARKCDKDSCCPLCDFPSIAG